MTKKPFRIAVAQSAIAQDVRANGAHMRGLMREAATSGAHLIHFPEGALSGYVKAQIKAWDEVDWDALRKEIELTAALAGELGIWTVFGLNHRLTAPNRPHNSLCVISNRGELVGRYDKRLCSYTEIHDWYTPGFSPLVFEAEGYSFGCALCIEVKFPHIFAEYEELGVDCVLVSSYSEEPVFGLLARGHAAANCYWVSLSVPAVCGKAYPGSLFDPNGDIVKQCDPNGEPSLAIADLDTSAPHLDIALNKARPWRKVSREGEIYRARQVQDERSTAKTKI